MAKWDHDDLRNRADEMRGVPVGHVYPFDTVDSKGGGANVVVTNTPRPGDSLEQLEARAARVMPKPRALDTQVGGDHYHKLPIQPFEYSMKNGLDPMQHTIIKYVTRFRSKGGRKDLEKAKHTIDLLIENDYGVSGN